MRVITSADAAWGGFGWGVLPVPEPGENPRLPRAPIGHGHISVGQHVRRTQDLFRALDDQILPCLAGHEVVMASSEKPGMFSFMGNQPAICYGIGTACGVFQAWVVSRLGLEPVEVDLQAWRRWWVLRGAKKEDLKLASCQLTDALWGEALLSRYPYRKADGGARGDVSDACLQGGLVAGCAGGLVPMSAFTNPKPVRKAKKK